MGAKDFLPVHIENGKIDGRLAVASGRLSIVTLSGRRPTTASTAAGLFLGEEEPPETLADRLDELDRSEPADPLPRVENLVQPPLALAHHRRQTDEDDGQEEQGNENVPELAEDDIHR